RAAHRAATPRRGVSALALRRDDKSRGPAHRLRLADPPPGAPRQLVRARRRRPRAARRARRLRCRDAHRRGWPGRRGTLPLIAATRGAGARPHGAGGTPGKRRGAELAAAPAAARARTAEAAGAVAPRPRRARSTLPPGCGGARGVGLPPRPPRPSPAADPAGAPARGTARGRAALPR